MGVLQSDGREIQEDAQRRKGCGIFSTHPLWRGFPKISRPHRLQHPSRAAQPAPNLPWCELWGLRVSDIPSPRGQPTAGDGGTWDGGEGFFLTCLGLCWGLPGSSLGLWDTETKRVRALSALHRPWGHEIAPIFGKGRKGPSLIWFQ